MKKFIESFLCPSMRIALAGFCFGRGAECFSCKSIVADSNAVWSYTKCKPNRNLLNHQICSRGKYQTLDNPILLGAVTEFVWVYRFFTSVSSDALEYDFCPRDIDSDFSTCPFQLDSTSKSEQDKVNCCWKKLQLGERLTCKSLMNTNPEFYLNQEALDKNDKSLLAYQSKKIPM